MDKSNVVFKNIIKPVYHLAKLIGYKGLDYYDILRGKKNRLIPPRSMIFVGDGDYEKTGTEFLKYFIDLGKIAPSAKILDVGCGIGRMAVPLTSYLNNEGEYYGFDIVKKGIDWCNKNISSRFPIFHFAHADIFNLMYNLNGSVKSSEYKFQYDDNTFDFIFLTSVFTHMYTNDVGNYLKEISRVMKSGGRCLITFFLLNEISEKLIGESKSTQNLIHELDEYSCTKDNNIPENAIGFKEDFIRELFAKSNLQIEEPIHYGSWCGRENYKSYQDMIIAIKV